MSVDEDVSRLLLHLDRLGLEPTEYARGWGDHIGAALTDTALQRRTRYKPIVQPRVQALLRLWPDATTVSAFRRRLETEDIGTVIRWRRPAKLIVLTELTTAMTDLPVETDDDLHRHLSDVAQRDVAVRRLRAISGVGPKTIDYLSVLNGVTGRVPIDTHLRRFAADSGIRDHSYSHLQEIYVAAADTRGWSPSALDAAVWKHMNKRGS